MEGQVNIRTLYTRNNLLQSDQSYTVSPLQLIFGYADAETTGVRESIRGLLMNYPVHNTLAHNEVVELDVESNTQVARLMRNGNQNTFTNTRLHESIECISKGTYNDFFDLNFGGKQVIESELCRRLNNFFDSHATLNSRNAGSIQELESPTRLF